MSRENEEPQSTSSVNFRVPDFVDDDGIEYTDIEADDACVSSPHLELK